MAMFARGDPHSVWQEMMLTSSSVRWCRGLCCMRRNNPYRSSPTLYRGAEASVA